LFRIPVGVDPASQTDGVALSLPPGAWIVDPKEILSSMAEVLPVHADISKIDAALYGEAHELEVGWNPGTGRQNHPCLIILQGEISGIKLSPFTIASGQITADAFWWDHLT
jgi:hypothetical protein